LSKRDRRLALSILSQTAVGCISGICARISLCHLCFYEITRVHSFPQKVATASEVRLQHEWNVAKAWLLEIRFPASLISRKVSSQLTSSLLAALRGYTCCSLKTKRVRYKCIRDWWFANSEKINQELILFFTTKQKNNNYYIF